MQCIRCGKEMINTTGCNYHCPSCNMAVNDLVYRSSNCDMPLPQGFGKLNAFSLKSLTNAHLILVSGCTSYKDAS